MRRYLRGHENTEYGAQAARRKHLKNRPGSTVFIGYDPERKRMFLDIQDAPCSILRMKPQLRLVVNNG